MKEEMSMDEAIITVPSEQVEQVRAEVAPVLDAARAIIVTDRGSYEHAMALGAECASRIKRIEEIFGPARESTHKAWKAVTATVASFVDPLKEAKGTCATKATAWVRTEEARVRAEEAARQEEAQRRADAAAQAAGAAPASMAILGTPVQVAAVPRPVPTSRIVGSAAGTIRENWTMRVTDLMALVKAVASGEVDQEVLQANEVVLRKRAKALKTAMKYPGVEVFDEGAAVFRAR